MLQYLPLLADYRNCILQLDVMKEALQKNIGYADQVVVLLSFVERVGLLAVRFHRLTGRAETSQSLPVYILISCSKSQLFL